MQTFAHLPSMGSCGIAWDRNRKPACFSLELKLPTL